MRSEREKTEKIFLKILGTMLSAEMATDINAEFSAPDYLASN